MWFMRQAGRFLPEYRAVRATTKDFISFCLDPEKAADVTLQPLRRFPFDAAIVFADILLIPMALGQEVWFEAGEGPRLGELPSIEVMRGRIDGVEAALGNVGETLRRVRAELEPERALIGFAGAPWTVLTYMLQGKGGEREEARAHAYAHPEQVAALIDILIEATARYMAMQARAGAQALQIFESWAEGLPDDQFRLLVTEPHARLIARLRELGVDLPLIGFPRGAGALLTDYAAAVPVQGLGLDTQTPLAFGKALQAGGKTIQGALDPLQLRAGGAGLDRRVDELLEAWSGGPYIFNLGHGILPDTPIEHVRRVVARVTGR
ncbi:MAG: uroporphyrinogen decarboxylase [Pseudomonadota bacterium]|nr:uroporphyrinogen decarboxylase [Pseudomonadota bacterium]